MYVGKTFVNANANKDELTLSLGKDPNISVSRTLISDKSGTKMLSSRKVQDFVYEISVRNNKREHISIVVEDQIPISSNSDRKSTRLNSSHVRISYAVFCLKKKKKKKC